LPLLRYKFGPHTFALNFEESVVKAGRAWVVKLADYGTADVDIDLRNDNDSSGERSPGCGIMAMGACSSCSSTTQDLQFGAPIGVRHFTTLENSPIEHLLLGSMAVQSFAADTYALGLCVLHLFTGTTTHLLNEIIIGLTRYHSL
jgi:hypothetical protein